MEIESRLLPCGLHIVGCPPTAEEAIATLVNIGELDRPDNNPPIKARCAARACVWGGGVAFCDVCAQRFTSCAPLPLALLLTPPPSNPPQTPKR